MGADSTVAKSVNPVAVDKIFLERAGDEVVLRLNNEMVAIPLPIARKIAMRLLKLTEEGT